MKKINNIIKHVLVVMALILVASCVDNDVDPLFDQSVNERTDALKQEYLEALTSSEDGWIGYYSPNKDFGIYSVLMKFDEDGSVQINSDYNQGEDDNSITYRIDKSLKIELVLESFAVFHQIFSINDNNNGGEFVFNILSATESEIVLESKTDTGDDITVLTLRKALPEDLDLDALKVIESGLAGGEDGSGPRNILLNDVEIGSFTFGVSDRTATITYFDESGAEITTSVRIIVTADGFELEEPLTINGVVLSAFITNDADGYSELSNADLVLSDFVSCGFNVDNFVGTYVANEEGYCDGCYEVEVSYVASVNVFVLSNLYDYGEAAVIQLNPVASASNPSVDFVGVDYDIPVQIDDNYGNVWAVNPSYSSGIAADDISTFDTCTGAMDLYFGRCVSAGCFSGLVHIELTKK